MNFASRFPAVLLRLLPVAALALLAACDREPAAPSGAPAAGTTAVRTPAPLQLVAEDSVGRSLTVRTERLEAKFRDGRIVHLVNRLTGETVCDEALGNDELLPGGLGLIAGNLPAMRAAHIPWGSLQLGQQLKTDAFRANYRQPGAKSAFSVERSDDGSLLATWRGLTDGRKDFPELSLSVALSTAPDGSLAIRASGSAAEGGVFGIQVPLANVVPASRFILPSFGGLRYDRAHEPVIMSLGGAPFIETPAAAFETAIGSVGLWNEDPRFPDYYLFWGWDGKSFSLAFEHLNLMPFEPRRDVESVTWKLDVFKGGWVDAYTPYRDWYRKTFAAEFTARDAVAWARDIRVILDNYATTPEAMRVFTTLFDSGTVLLHNWNARAPAFDTELPDWTPREGYAEAVRLAREHGLKTMAYVNTYCINYNSPLFVRDNLRNIFLTRKASIYRYGDATEPGQISELLIGTINRAEGGDPFAGIRDGQILYGDPLSAGWRSYHCAQMREWNRVTGTDANYEDTAGCAGDFGNGEVDGLAGAEGSVAMLRDLLASQPGVPMASEYGPAPIAFGVLWPLNYAQVWGNDEFRRFRLHRQHPVSAYLYGNRQWVPTVAAETDFLKHLVTGCSDALGGVAQAPGAPALLAADRGMDGHLVRRAALFSRLRLAPVFERERYAKDMVCLYEDRDGRRYRYTDDGSVQRMTGPDGRDLYARVTGVNRLRTALRLPGWPAAADGEIFGLKRAGNYALFPLEEAGPAPALRVTALSPEVSVSRYVEDEAFSLLCLEAEPGGPARARVDLALDRDFPRLSVNGDGVKPEKTLSMEVRLPATILYSREGAKAEPGKKIGDGTTVRRSIGAQGLALDAGIPLERVTPGEESGRYFFSWGPGVKTADFLVAVPDSPSAALRLEVVNRSSIYGDASRARILVNGRTVLERDFGSPDLKAEEHDQRTYEWCVPMGEHAGRTVLVTIEGDGKLSDNADLLWIGIPEWIRDESKTATERVLVAGRSPSARDLVHDEDPAGWEGEARPNTEVKRAGAFSFELSGAYTSSLISKGYLPVEPGRTYVLSARLRSFDGKLPASANMGLRMYDKDKRPIHIHHVAVCPNTATKLAAAAAAGATELLLVRPAGFVAPEFSTVAFHAADDYSDLPNFELSPEVIALAEDGDRVRLTLKAPMTKDYPAGIPVRLHLPWGAPCYWVADGWLDADWKEFTATFRGEARTGTSLEKFWRGTRYVRPFVWFGNYNRTPEPGARLLVDEFRFTEQ